MFMCRGFSAICGLYSHLMPGQYGDTLTPNRPAMAFPGPYSHSLKIPVLEVARCACMFETMGASLARASFLYIRKIWRLQPRANTAPTRR
jgi:hypothetical protein